MSSPPKTTEETPAAAAGESKEEQRKASQSSQGSEPSGGERTRTVSSGSGGYDDTAPKRRQRSFSASESGRTIVIAVDASDDAKFAFECKWFVTDCLYRDHTFATVYFAVTCVFVRVSTASGNQGKIGRHFSSQGIWQFLLKKSGNFDHPIYFLYIL